MHFYTRNIGDYHKKAGRLTILQHGVYMLLLDACYDREKFPTKDEAIEWVWADSEDELKALDFVLKRFFVEKDGRYWQSRIEQELETYREKESERRARKEAERERKERYRKHRAELFAKLAEMDIYPDFSAPNKELEALLSQQCPAGQDGDTHGRPRESSGRDALGTAITNNHKPVTNNHKPNNKNTGDNSPVDFSQFGFSESQFAEIKRIRTKNAKNKKQAELTDRILKALANEFNSAKPLGYSFEDCLTTWEARGWLSFEAGWLTPKEQKAPVTPLRKEFVPGGQR